MYRTRWYASLLGVAVLLTSPQIAWAAPVISNLSDNRSSYSNDQIPAYEKLELTATISTVSQKPFLPYDEMTVPIPGLTPKLGISVDGLFLPPGGTNWTNAYKQPGFYFVEYTDHPNGSALYYPTGRTFWKVRFAPPPCPGGAATCSWQYKLTARDSSGVTESAIQNITVTKSTSHGFIQVSKRDPRYFEYSDGTYFPNMGVNDNLDKNNPVLGNQAFLGKLGSNGIQVLRFWLTNWTIFGSSWTTWESIKNTYDGYLPRAGLITNRAESTASVPSSVLTLSYSEEGSNQNQGSWFDACHLSVAGGSQIRIATKPNTKYRIRIRYQAIGISGPRDPSYPGYGFVLKRQNPNDGNWHRGCFNGGDPVNGVKLTGYGHDTADWTSDPSGNWTSPNWAYLESDWIATGDAMPILYLALENAKNITSTVGGGKAYNWHPTVNIDTVEFREIRPDGSLGQNIIPRSTMSYLDNVMDKNAYAFDKVVELAKQQGVYLKTVILEKNEHVENEISQNGTKAIFNNNNFYGNWRFPQAVRWYQQAWWRYLQARWGYSTSIHSWELVNEADTSNGNHWAQTDELGKYMHCLAFGITKDTSGNDLSNPPVDGRKCSYQHPNAHPVSTSFWYGFPKAEFWGNSKFPNVDYTDVHDYINKPSEPAHYWDTALATYNLGQAYGAKQPGGAGKPVMRGETGLITDDGTDAISNEMDNKGVWLHNLIWGGINPFGLTEQWWHVTQIYTGSKDLRPLYKQYYDFIKDVPLSNGRYQDAAATATDTYVRVWGQKDSVGQIANRAHLWVQNKKHLWCAVANRSGCPMTWDNSRLNGTVTLDGFTPNTTYPVEWWSFDTNVQLAKTTGSLPSNASGQLTLNLSTLPATVVDVGVKIGTYTTAPTGSCPEDLNTDNQVNITDLLLLLQNWSHAPTGSQTKYDLNHDGTVGVADLLLLLQAFGRNC